MREVIKTAATVDEAIALALAELGLPREKVTCEVLQYPERKFFFKKILMCLISLLKADMTKKYAKK